MDCPPFESHACVRINFSLIVANRTALRNTNFILLRIFPFIFYLQYRENDAIVDRSNETMVAAILIGRAGAHRAAVGQSRV